MRLHDAITKELKSIENFPEFKGISLDISCFHDEPKMDVWVWGLGMQLMASKTIDRINFKSYKEIQVEAVAGVIANLEERQIEATKSTT